MNPTNLHRAAVAAAVRRVAAPYRLHTDKLVQIPRADDICPTVYIYYFERSEITPQPRLAPSQLPYRGD